MRAKAVAHSITAALVACALSGCGPQDDAGLERIINQYGFSRNTPASLLYGPGQLVAREQYDPNEQGPPRTVRLTDLCIRKYSVGLYRELPSESPSESMAVGSQIGGSFSLSAPALKNLLNLGITAKAARNATATISDVKVYAFSQEDLLAIRQILGPNCRSIVNENLAKKNAYQVIKVLQATVDLNVSLSVSASATLKAQVVKELLNAGFSVEPAADTLSVKGTALYYGIGLVPLEGRV